MLINDHLSTHPTLKLDFAQLTLTDRTIKCGTTGLHQTTDNMGDLTTCASLIRATVYLKLMLKIAQRAVCLNIVA
jgi:hypothetical protein